MYMMSMQWGRRVVNAAMLRDVVEMRLVLTEGDERSGERSLQGDVHP